MISSQRRRVFFFAILACLGAISVARAADDEPTVALKDDPYRRVVFENELVRVWEVKVPVGECTPFHEHKSDEVSVRINTTTITNTPRGHLFNFASDYSLESGSVSFNQRAGGDIHKVCPKGPNPHHVVESELVSSRPPVSAAADSPQRAGATTVLDNPRFLASRVILEPGQSSNIAPRRNTLVVVVKGGPVSGSALDASMRSLKAGQVQWHAEAGARSLKNEGTSAMDLIELEVR